MHDYGWVTLSMKETGSVKTVTQAMTKSKTTVSIYCYALGLKRA